MPVMPVMKVTKITDERAGKQSRAVAAAAGLRRRALPLFLLLVFTACALLTLFAVGRADAVTNSPQRAPLFVPAQDYSRFSHSTPGAHAALTSRWSCSICHDRRGNSVEPGFPQHKDCISCHQTQFTTPDSPLCTICHQAGGFGQQNPPLKKFPGLRSFNTEFDHAQHNTGDARAQSGCAACHAPARNGVARTIPAGLSAHQTCYQCHTPGRQSRGHDISSCGACHNYGRYAPTPATARSFRIGFSHADHGPRQNLNCEQCHTVGARGLAQGRQVTSTFPAQHFPQTRSQSCATCHNGQRSFGEVNFNDCKRCHTGQTFRL